MGRRVCMVQGAGSTRVGFVMFISGQKMDPQKKSTSGEVRTHALKRGPELESGALTTRPQMLGWLSR